MQPSSVNNEWVMPFVSELQPGQNNFAVNVPLHFCYNTFTASPNKLYFSKLDLIPDFFGVQAEELDLDTTDEENMIVDVDLALAVLYNSKYLDPKLPLNTRVVYRHNSAQREDHVKSVLDFLSPSNTYFAKTNFQKFPVFFWDWFDEGRNEQLTAEEFIKKKATFPTVENFFYGTVGQMSTTHFRRDLMETENVKFFPSKIINPYVFPSKKADSGDNTVHTLRIRFHLQPKTSLSFSNAGLLSILGFDVFNNPHIKNINKQYIVENNSSTEWLELVATDAPSLANWELENKKLPAMDTKVYLKISDPFIVQRTSGQVETYNYTIQMTKTQLQDETLFKTKIGSGLITLGNQSNLNVSFQYGNGKIIIPDPSTSNGQLISAKLILPSKTIATKLNYQTSEISNASEQFTTTQAKPTEKDKLNFDLKAKSLVFDTNIVYVIALDTISSDKIHPLAPGFVASLHPEDSTMKMAVPWLKNPDYFRLAEYQTGTNQLQLKFELYTILANNQHVKLNWKAGATVCGIIRARM